jgi:hypothetical protein
MTKTTIIAALTLAAPASEASAQSRTFYDASGKRTGSATINSAGTSALPCCRFACHAR